MKTRNNQIDMIDSPIFKGMLVFSIPVIASNLLQLLFNAADVVIVGKYAGDVCLAAVSSTTHLVYLLTNIFTGMAIGVNVLVARLIGEKRYNAISDTIHTSITFAIACGVVSAIIGLFASYPALKAMECPGDIIDLAALYLRIYFLGMPALLVYNYGASILRAKGDTKRPLYFLILSGIVNVALNIILVTQFGMNVDGVAIATVVSQTISALLTLFLLIKEDDIFKFDFRKMSIKKEPLKEILIIGIPAGVQSSMFAISNVVLQSNINALGTTVVAGSGAANSIESFANGIVQAIGTAVTTFVSQNFGAEKKDRIKKTISISCLISFICCFVFFIVSWLFGKNLLYIYTDDPLVVEQGYIRLRVVLYSYYSYALMQIAVGALRGMGHSTLPAIISLIGVCGVRLFCIWFIFSELNIFTIMLTYPISWIATLIVVWILMIAVMKKLSF